MHQLSDPVRGIITVQEISSTFRLHVDQIYINITLYTLKKTHAIVGKGQAIVYQYPVKFIFLFFFVQLIIRHNVCSIDVGWVMLPG